MGNVIPQVICDQQAHAGYQSHDIQGYDCFTAVPATGV